MPTDFYLESDKTDRPLSITEFTRRVKALLETGLPPLWVRGEISNFRRQSSGHCYFSLKDAGSQLPCVLFRGDAARAEGVLRDGMQVLAYGSVNIYEPRGAYQLIVREVQEDGQGRLQMEFERLKKALAAEGLFDPARKRSIPKMPSTVGFITSPTGAAAQDFLRILKRRGWWGRVILMPVRVQGAEAAREMAAMLEFAATLPFLDALVIGRGGGSLEDLWAFNEEILVRAVAACPLPVISAVGHEIDFTLCDFAADLRAETPSAAAEVISSGFIECRDRLQAARERLTEKTRRQLDDARRSLELIGGRLDSVSPRNRIENAFLRLDDLSNRLHAGARAGLWEKKTLSAALRSRFEQTSPAHRVTLAAQQCAALRARWQRHMATELPARRDRIDHLGKRLRTLGPDSVLQRGFVLVRDENGVPIARREGIVPGTRLINEFADGTLPVRSEE